TSIPRGTPMRRTTTIAALIALLVVAVGSVVAAPAEPPLRLRYLDLPAPERQAALSALPVLPNRLIVQFRGPVGPAEQAALAATGVTVLEYIPDFAYLVGGSPAQLAAAAGLPGLARAVPTPAALNLDPT